LALITEEGIDGARAEEFLRGLWQRTFAHVALTQEDFLERTFIRRGRAFVERVYPNGEQRRRLYQFGFTPLIGRRFEPIAPAILAKLREAAEYGLMSAEDQFQLFGQLADLIREQPGLGFKARQTVGDQAILESWVNVLSWWLQRPEATPPDPEQLRAWQRFVSENLEFRLGVAVGAAVAQAWGEKAPAKEVPTLETWRDTSGLPWIGFWFRELLRWGTLDPFVAFALSQGLAETREEAAGLRPEFRAWLESIEVAASAENLIDPQLFLAWQRSRAEATRTAETILASVAELTGVDGRRREYDVRPIVRAEGIEWIDAAGFAVARSPAATALATDNPQRHDFSLSIENGTRVLRTF
jgi:hypothetical protein